MARLLNNVAVILGFILFVVSWLAGIVLAKGIIQTTFSLIPFYAWYLVIEKIMIAYNLI